MVGHCGAFSQIHLVEYSEDSSSVMRHGVFRHAADIIDLNSSPGDPRLLLTIGQSGAECAVTLWNVPGLPEPLGGDADSGDDNDDEDGLDVDFEHRSRASELQLTPGEHHELTPVWSLSNIHRDTPIAFHWRESVDNTPGVVPKSGLLVSRQSLQVAQFDHLDVSPPEGEPGPATTSASVEISRPHAFTCAAWDPHHSRMVVAGMHQSLQTWDTRTDELTPIAARAHTGGVTDVSYNPNRPWYVLSTGSDGDVLVWDIRAGSSSPDTCAPVLMLRGHEHWCTCGQYNPFHDQLAASGGSDGATVLWRVSSASAAPLIELDDDDNNNRSSGGEEDRQGGGGEKTAADTAVRRVVDHDEAVSGLAWSACNAWVVGSVSYSGRASFIQVPSVEKYKILL